MILCCSMSYPGCCCLSLNRSGAYLVVFPSLFSSLLAIQGQLNSNRYTFFCSLLKTLASILLFQTSTFSANTGTSQYAFPLSFVKWLQLFQRVLWWYRCHQVQVFQHLIKENLLRFSFKHLKVLHHDVQGTLILGQFTATRKYMGLGSWNVATHPTQDILFHLKPCCALMVDLRR